MPIQTTHGLTVATGDYKDELLTFLGIKEGFKGGLPYIDPKWIATIGYGFNIETVSAYMALTLNQLGILGNKTAAETQQILGEFIVAATAATGPTTDAATTDLQNRLNSLSQQYVGKDFTLDTTQARTIYDQILLGTAITVTSGSPLVIAGKQAHLDAILGNSLAHDTQEYVALMSMFYNTESLVAAGSKLATAVIEGRRADAWYEIRYQSNRERVTAPNLAQGIANRRYAESDRFGLYENAPLSETEAKSIFRMYTAHRDTIGTYESDPRTTPSSTDTFVHESQGARNLLLTRYASGTVPFGAGSVALPTIDGEVLVGRDTGPALALFETLKGTSNGDLLFGEGGRDVLEGRMGRDVLYGGDGFDTLVGGIGDDWLEGGEGLDTYRWSTGDGHDRIEDSDASGVIVVNGQMLVGGIKKAGHTDWTSLDGTITYAMAGTDLILERDGTTIMTVNENFQSGQLGIRLINAARERMAA